MSGQSEINPPLPTPVIESMDVFTLKIYPDIDVGVGCGSVVEHPLMVQ